MDDQPENSDSESAMGALESTALFVATMTGVRQQFIDAGWSSGGAEEMTIVIARSNLREAK